MRKNLGTIDKLIRMLLAAIIAILYITETISGVLAFILLALAIVLLLTSFVSFCPLYALLGLSSRKKKE